MAAVMTAYHRLDGERCGHHRRLLTEILKDEWGFDGFTVSGFVLGVRSAQAVAAGLDVEMPFAWRFRNLARQALRAWSGAGRRRRLRVLRRQVWFADRTGQAGEPDRYTPGGAGRVAHRALAREVAERSLVLLRNETVRIGPAAGAPVLPLDGAEVASSRWPCSAPARPTVALTSEPGPGRRAPCPVVTVLDGLRAMSDRWVINVETTGRRRPGGRPAGGRRRRAVVVAGPRSGARASGRCRRRATARCSPCRPRRRR